MSLILRVMLERASLNNGILHRVSNTSFIWRCRREDFTSRVWMSIDDDYGISLLFVSQREQRVGEGIRGSWVKGQARAHIEGSHELG